MERRKKFNAFKIIVFIIIALLIGGCIYFYKESKKLDNEILIGTPIDRNSTEYSKPIKSLQDSNSIQCALMRAVSIEKPSIVDKISDATIMINSRDVGLTYFMINVWFDKEQVIFSSGNKDDVSGIEYKETVGEGGKDVMNCISKYKSN